MQLGIHLGISSTIIGDSVPDADQSGAPSWAFAGAEMDFDFANQRYWMGTSKAITDVFTFSRASQAYALTSTGTLTSFASGVERVTDLGLFVEESRTNILQQSQTLDNAYWTKANCTITANAVAAPDGTTTADALVPSSGTNNVAISRSTNTVTSSTAYTYSMYLKLGSLGVNWVEMTTVSSTTGRAWFNLSTGAKGTSSGSPTYNIVALANSWYRIDMTMTSGSTNMEVYLCPRNADGNSTQCTGDGTSVAFYVWGMQLEAGAFPTSYITTTSASVTRAADVLGGLTAINNIACGARGTAYVSSGYVQTGDTSASRRALGGDSAISHLNPGSGTIPTSVSYRAYNGTTNVSSTTGAFNMVTTSGKGVMAWDSTGRSIVTNGATVVTDTNTYSYTQVYIGSNNGSSNFMNGFIQRVAYWNTKQSDTRIVTLST
jgi:hypothetical protein